MAYQVWIVDDYKKWERKDCSNLDEAKAVIMECFNKGVAPLLTQDLEYLVYLDIKESPVREKIGAKEKYKLGVEGTRKEVDSEAT